MYLGVLQHDVRNTLLFNMILKSYTTHFILLVIIIIIFIMNVFGNRN